jgi:NTP pyrophosphatase (non-canonical NTP hydrolase)
MFPGTPDPENKRQRAIVMGYMQPEPGETVPTIEEMLSPVKIVFDGEETFKVPKDLQPLHPDSRQLLRDFFAALADKLVRNQSKYGYTNEWKTRDWEHECRQELTEHIGKGDPKDVAIYAAFMWHHSWPTAPVTPAFEQLAKQHMLWALQTFPTEGALSGLTKLQEELREVRDCMYTGSDVELAEEYADCIMCLLSSAAHVSIPASEIIKAFAAKLEKNKGREWTSNGDGTHSHVNAEAHQ